MNHAQTLAALESLALADDTPERFRTALVELVARIRIAATLDAESTSAARTALAQRDDARRGATAELVNQLTGPRPAPNPLAIVEDVQHLDRRHETAIEVARIAAAAHSRLVTAGMAEVFHAHAVELFSWVARERSSTPLPGAVPLHVHSIWERIASRWRVQYPAEVYDGLNLDTPPKPEVLTLATTNPDHAERVQYAWDAIAAGEYRSRGTRPEVIYLMGDWERRRRIEATPVTPAPRPAARVATARR